MSELKDDFEIERQSSTIDEIGLQAILNELDKLESPINPSWKHPKCTDSKSANIFGSWSRNSRSKTYDNRKRTRSQSPASKEQNIANNYNNNPAAKRAQTPPSPKKVSTSMWSIAPNVTTAAKQTTETLFNIQHNTIPTIANTSNHLNETLQIIDKKGLPQLMKTMKMIQDTTANINEFLRFSKVVIIITMALFINYLYKHTEFVLIVVVILIFVMDVLNIWNETYFESIDDENIIIGTIVKITGDKQRLNRMWKESGLRDMINKDKYLNVYGEIIDTNKRYECVLIKCVENGEKVWIPVTVCG
eukprot:475009_1